MANPTEDDLRVAREIINTSPCGAIDGYEELATAIASALAAEREKAAKKCESMRPTGGRMACDQEQAAGEGVPELIWLHPDPQGGFNPLWRGYATQDTGDIEYARVSSVTVDEAASETELEECLRIENESLRTELGQIYARELRGDEATRIAEKIGFKIAPHLSCEVSLEAFEKDFAEIIATELNAQPVQVEDKMQLPGNYLCIDPTTAIDEVHLKLCMRCQEVAAFAAGENVDHTCEWRIQHENLLGVKEQDNKSLCAAFVRLIETERDGVKAERSQPDLISPSPYVAKLDAKLEALTTVLAKAKARFCAPAASPVQVDEVSKALEELREMFPGRSVRITHQWNEGSETDPRGKFVEVCILADDDNDWSAFIGTTLSEAMAKVREWHDEGKQVDIERKQAGDY